MPTWIPFVLLTAIFWGLWGFFLKFASHYISPATSFIFQFLGSAIVLLIVLIVQSSQLVFHPKGAIYALLAGFLGGIGGMFFLFAIKHGKASVVLVLSNALYPIVTMVLVEIVTFSEGLGIFLALSAVGLLATR